jgi:hypothetical protein
MLFYFLSFIRVNAKKPSLNRLPKNIEVIVRTYTEMVDSDRMLKSKSPVKIRDASVKLKLDVDLEALAMMKAKKQI